MPDFSHASQAALEIRALASKAAACLPRSTEANKLAHHHVVRPIDYMRIAEFESVLRGVGDMANQRVLDIGSPQWFSIYLAARNPTTRFVYVNIIDSELDPYREIAIALGLDNLSYEKGDVRALRYESSSFHKAISISVIEHIYPEVGGDVAALKEINRVLAPGGTFLVTTPCKMQRNVVYKEGPVYERAGSGRNFYAREYDEATFAELIASGGFSFREQWLICERQGMFAIDFLEWGPGRGGRWGWLFGKVRRTVERTFGLSFDRLLAFKYLDVARVHSGRLVNISAVAGKGP